MRDTELREMKQSTSKCELLLYIHASALDPAIMTTNSSLKPTDEPYELAAAKIPANSAREAAHPTAVNGPETSFITV
jgi:hypothetical protein